MTHLKDIFPSYDSSELVTEKILEEKRCECDSDSISSRKKITFKKNIS